MPILGDLYDELLKQPEPEAARIAAALELYVSGSLNVFNHRTNVELSNRLVCFDIKQLGKQLKKLGMLIVQDQVWNRDALYSPNKTHFMAELSPAFMRLAATKDTDRLFSMLPYKTLSFSKIEGRHGTYALIDKGENRDRKIRKPRPSIRAQLKADKAKTAPKKAAAKTKNHDMEV